jgi:hypothetical protein
MRWFILLFLPLYVANAEAGLSYLGLCAKGWNCKGTIASYNRVEQINIGWLENTFARDCRCAKQILNQDKPVTLRVHLTNSPCLRNNRCGSYEVFAGETVASASKKIARRNRRLLTKYRAVVKRFKKRLDNAKAPVACYVSPCLECDLSAKARRVLFTLTARLLPRCTLVDSVYRRRCLEGYICEKHGQMPVFDEGQQCIADLDGVDGKTTNLPVFKSYTKQCLMRYYWEYAYNCIRRGIFVDPRKRDCHYSSKYLRKQGGVLCHLSYNQSCDML